MDIACKETFRLINGESSHRDLLTDDRRLRFEIFLHVHGAFDAASEQSRYVRGILFGDDLCDLFRYFGETGILRHEIGLAVDFDQHARLAFDIGSDDAFRRDSGSFLLRFCDAAFSQKVGGFGLSPSVSW